MYAHITNKGKPAIDVLPEVFAAMINGLAYPRAMRWGCEEFKFLRPIRWLVALLENEIVPLEIIVRNIIAGSMAKRLGIEEGTIPSNVVYELCYKNDAYGDPLINEDHAVALDLATYEELAKIKEMTLEINKALIEFFDAQDIRLIDFKIEFGRTKNGEIVLADEISPDTCRLWDKKTNEKLDKDRFRRDLGNVEEAYIEILNRVSR